MNPVRKLFLKKTGSFTRGEISRYALQDLANWEFSISSNRDLWTKISQIRNGEPRNVFTIL